MKLPNIPNPLDWILGLSESLQGWIVCIGSALVGLLLAWLLSLTGMTFAAAMVTSVSALVTISIVLALLPVAIESFRGGSSSKKP